MFKSAGIVDEILGGWAGQPRVSFSLIVTVLLATSSEWHQIKLNLWQSL